MASRYPRNSRGFTLLELLIVLTLLATIAAIAMPSGTPVRLHSLELAASQLADALRFARNESRRTGYLYGVTPDIGNNTIRVFRLDEGPSPNLKVFDVYDPVTKQLYAVDFNSSAYRGVTIAGVDGDVLGNCTDTGNIAFDLAGVVRCTEPVATRILDTDIELRLDDSQIIVSVDGHTGRVTIR